MDLNLLNDTLDKAVVSSRKKGDISLSYIEGWWAIAEANRIFGFDGWTRETIYNKEVCRYEYNDKNKVGYEAHVRVGIMVNNRLIEREGTGHGSGIAKDLFDAIEGAAKEAETDAMKRALMTFGNPFGLALYDKKQRFVESHKHRFNPGEKEAIYTSVMSALKSGDEKGLKEILDEYQEQDEKMKVWAMFNSTERAAIKDLLTDD